MKNTQTLRISLIIVGVLLLLCVGIGIAIAVPREDDVITVTLPLKEEEILSFDSVSLAPGDACTYNIVLKTKVTDEYGVRISFAETEDSPLLEHMHVRMKFQGEILCDRPMCELTDGEMLTLSADLARGWKYPVEITYYLPESVGNEAQEAEAFFELHIIANNEGK